MLGTKSMKGKKTDPQRPHSLGEDTRCTKKVL